jgi:hypothetical protein
MTFLRNIGADLVEKRLWPVAVALLVALIAVPTLLAKSANEEPEAMGPAPVAGAAAVKADQVLALNTAPAGRRKRGGKPKNPFVQLYVPKVVEVTTTSEAAGGDAGAAKDDSAASGDSGSSKGETAPAAPKTSKPKVDLDVYRATLRFGEPGAMRTISDIARLTPLPSADDPFFVFVGVKEDGETLVFLVSSDAKATGDGKCKPSTDNCETIELKAGDTEFFDLMTATGLKQYQMDVVSVSSKKASSAAAARKAHARQSKAGAALLKAASKNSKDPKRIGRYRWNPRRGVLDVIPRKQLKAKVASKAIAGTASVP